MIDMHIHTNYSDGINSAQEILETANKLDISIISITDHNSVSAYVEILKNNLMDKYNFILVPGVELKCHIDKEIIELLVYDFNIVEMKQFISENYNDWEYINKSMTMEFEKILVNYDIIYDKNIVMTHDYSKYNGIMELYKSVLKDENNYDKLGSDLQDNIPNFFRKCVCNENNRFYVDSAKYYPSVEDIFNFTKNNNSKVLMPHVYLFNNGFDILKNIHKKYKIDGVECYHPSYTIENNKELVNYCNNNDLYISAGSDYHGNGYMLGCTSDFYDNDNIKLFEFRNAIIGK